MARTLATRLLLIVPSWSILKSVERPTGTIRSASLTLMAMGGRSTIFRGFRPDPGIVGFRFFRAAAIRALRAASSIFLLCSSSIFLLRSLSASASASFLPVSAASSALCWIEIHPF
jgi:hypothetical protein